MQRYITKLLIAITDIIWLICLFYITIFVRESIEVFGIVEFDRFELSDFSFVIFIVFSLMYYENIYRFRYDFWQDTLKVLKAFGISFLLTLSFLALTQSNLEYSRLFILLYFTMGIVLIPIAKRYTKKLIFKVKAFNKKVLVVGLDEQVEIFKKEIAQNWYLGQVYSENNYQSVIIVSQGLEIEKFNTLIAKYLDKHSELFVVPYITNINFMHSNILEYSNIRLNTIQIENKLLIKRNIWVKNLFDKFFTVLVSPIFLFIHFIVVVAIKLDSKGDIFFKQYRLGKDNENFQIFKYRTMYENGDELLKEYLKENPDEVSYYEHYHKYKNDPRVTKIGKILRATSIDELPQLINVLKNEMSLIGPRPYMLSESKKLDEYRYFILKVKPGVTGLWQVTGRNNLTFKQRNELEVWYIKNWSLWADLVILIKTIKVVISKLGAK